MPSIPCSGGFLLLAGFRLRDLRLQIALSFKNLAVDGKSGSTIRDTIPPAKIRAVTLGSNFTARISCQVSFCRCKISGLELIFSVVDLDFRAVDQSIGVEPLHCGKAMPEQSTS